MQDPAAVLGYQELFQRIVPVELRSFSLASPLSSSGLLNQQLPLQLKDFYTNFYYREVLPAAAAAALAAGAGGGSSSSSICSGGSTSPCSCTGLPGGGLYHVSAASPLHSSSSSATAAAAAVAAAAAAGGRSAGVEMMKVRVLSHVVSGVTTAVRLELSCDSCLFFHYAANISAASFQDIKEDCHLVIDFAQLPALLLRLLNLLLDQPATFLATLLLAADGAAELAFSQNLDFKTLGLMSIRVEAVPQALVRGYVTMRHNALLDHCADLEAELAELRSLVRQRCPNLLQLQGSSSSSSSKGPGGYVPRRLLC